MRKLPHCLPNKTRICLVICFASVFFSNIVLAQNYCGPASWGVIKNMSFLSKFSNRNFNYACKIHDECYDKCGMSQKVCDIGFLHALQLECEAAYANSSLIYLCQNITSGFYFELVDNFGKTNYMSGQEKNCPVNIFYGESTPSLWNNMSTKWQGLIALFQQKFSASYRFL